MNDTHVGPLLAQAVVEDPWAVLQDMSEEFQRDNPGIVREVSVATKLFCQNGVCVSGVGDGLAGCGHMRCMGVESA